MLKIILIVLLINMICISMYCRVERYIDEKKIERESKRGGGIQMENPNSLREPFIKRIYHWINAYVYGWVRYNILIVGHLPSYRLRNFLYRFEFGMQISSKTVIFGGCEFRSPWNIKIGRSTISANCILDGRGAIIIDDDVVLGSGVHIWTEEHSVNDPFFRVLKENLQPVYIKRHAWICSDSSILPGVVVEEGAVLASRACATKRCEKFSVYGGIPAKKISDRNCDLKYELSGKVSWHFM